MFEDDDWFDPIWQDDWEHPDFEGYPRDPAAEADEFNNE
jgi:hypothetical protein